MDKKQFYGKMLGSIRQPLNRSARNSKMQLWDQEFDIVDEGLAPEQVVGFITELVNKHKALEEQQEHFISLATLSEKAAMEADKIAADIKARARGEARAEAARIVAEANARSQEMLAEAKKAAQETTKQQVETIHQLALKEATTVRTQARQQAQLFLIKTRETLESDLQHEVKEAYNQLLFSLQELMSKGNELEVQWKDKTLELCKKESFELEGFDMDSYVLASETVKPFLLINEKNMAEIDIPDMVKETGALNR